MLSWTAGHSDVNEAPLKYVAEIRLGKMLQSAPGPNSDVEVPYIKATHVSWSGVDTSALPRMYASPREIELYGVRAGDLLVCEGGEAGRSSIVGELSTPTIVQNAVHRVRSTKVDLRYLKYCMEAVSASGWFDILTNKATIAHLTAEKLRSLRIPYRSLRSQQLIADFLDRETQRIDALIDAKRRMIDLLQEKRSAIRNHLLVNLASTPQVPLKRQADITVGIVVQPARLYAREGVPAIRGLNVQEGEVNRRDLRFITEQANRAHSKSILREGDVVVVRTGQAGAAAVVPSWAIGGNCIDLLLVRPSASLDCRFLEYWLNSHLTAHQVEKFSVGAIQSHYNVGALRELLIGIPSLTQQRAIVRQLDQREGPITRAVSLLSTQISHLSEYRQALITKAVTGQLDEATLKGKKPADEVVRV